MLQQVLLVSSVTNMFIKWKFGDFSPEKGQIIDKCNFTLNTLAMTKSLWSFKCVNEDQSKALSAQCSNDTMS